MNSKRKVLLGVALGCTLIISSMAQNQDINLVIEDVRDSQGAIWVALHKPSDSYMKERFMWISIPAQKGTVTGVIKDVPSGTYGISIMHDANNNRELDKNGIGIPKEGFGFSNDAMGKFGPPDFDKISFEFPKRKKIEIKMKYM